MMAAGRYSTFNPAFLKKYATLDYYLNRGASGNVFGPISWHGVQMALKQATFADGYVTDKVKSELEKKKEIWISLEHKHLTKFFTVDLSQLPKAMFILMEFAVGGSLQKNLRSLECKRERKLPIDVVTDWAKQIAAGMMYLHEKNIVHRDLKSSNILLMQHFDIRKPDISINLKITDFDEVKEHDHTVTMSLVGTYAYMAPEVLNDQWFSKVSDVWSYGVVVWEMLSGDIPHKELAPRTIIYKSQVGELDYLPIEQSFPEDFKRPLKRCWDSVIGRPMFYEIFCVLQLMAMDKYDIQQQKTKHEPAKFDDSGTLKVTSPKVVQKRSKSINQSPGNTAIYGLAVLGDEVFISRIERPYIEVYDSSTLELKRVMLVNGMTDPEHIVSCTLNYCLYASDWCYKHRVSILRIDPITGKLIKTWKIAGSGGRLSIASDSHVILNIDHEAKLHEYTADGEFIREIDIGSCTDITRSWHAVKLNSGRFVVCHGGYVDPLNRVCLLSVKSTTSALGRTDEAELRATFGAEAGEPIKNRLMGPVYLSVNKGGSILISDASKKAVLLNYNLEKPQIIVSEEHGLSVPWRTCFDESTDQWFVSDYQRVMVCRVKGTHVERKLYDLTSY